MSWQISWSNREQGDLAVLMRFKKAGFKSTWGAVWKQFFGKIDMRWGVLLRYVCRICADIYFDMKDLKQFEINLFWDQCIYYSLRMFHTSSWRLPDWSLPEAKHAGRSWTLGFPKKQFLRQAVEHMNHGLIDCLEIPGTTWRSRTCTQYLYVRVSYK